eukprot:833142_1
MNKENNILTNKTNKNNHANKQSTNVSDPKSANELLKQVISMMTEFDDKLQLKKQQSEPQQPDDLKTSVNSEKYPSSMDLHEQLCIETKNRFVLFTIANKEICTIYKKQLTYR